MPGVGRGALAGRAATHRRGVQLLVVTVREPSATGRPARVRGHSGAYTPASFSWAAFRAPSRGDPRSEHGLRRSRAISPVPGVHCWLLGDITHAISRSATVRRMGGLPSRSQVTVDSPRSGPRHVVNGPLTVRRHRQEITHYGDPRVDAPPGGVCHEGDHLAVAGRNPARV